MEVSQPTIGVTMHKTRQQAERQPSDRSNWQHRVDAVLGALAELEVFKAGEESRTLHAHGCTFLAGACSCPGGPEIMYADWDERVPSQRRYQAAPWTW